MLIFFNIEKVINILGSTKGDEIYKYVEDYLSVIILFSTFYMSGYAFEIYIKVDGRPSYPVACVLAGLIINIFLDNLFVVIFKYVVNGAAIKNCL